MPRSARNDTSLARRFNPSRTVLQGRATRRSTSVWSSLNGPPHDAALVAAAVQRAAVRAIDVAVVGAVGDAKLGERVVALGVGDARLARREPVPGLVQALIDGRGVSSVRGVADGRGISDGCAEKGAGSIEATQAAAAGLVEPAAGALERATVQRTIVVEAVPRAVKGGIGAPALGVVVAGVPRTQVVRLLGGGGAPTRGEPAGDRAAGERAKETPRRETPWARDRVSWSNRCPSMVVLLLLSGHVDRQGDDPAAPGQCQTTATSTSSLATAPSAR